MLRYDIFYLTGALLASPVLLARTLRTGKWRTDWKARFGHLAPLDGLRAGSTVTGDATGGMWVASRVRGGVAEPAPPSHRAGPRGQCGRGRGHPGTGRETWHGRARVVVSSTTDTGVERARSLYGGRHPVVRYPFDLSWMVRRFLDAVRPDAVALAELEVWPNFVSECTRRGIPVCVVNGRLSTPSYRGYQRARRWVRPVFRQLTAVGAQNEVYARRFVELGTPARTGAGDRHHEVGHLRPPPNRPPGRAAGRRAGHRSVPPSHRRRIDRSGRGRGADRHPSPRRPAAAGAPQAGAVRCRRHPPPRNPPPQPVGRAT